MYIYPLPRIHSRNVVSGRMVNEAEWSSDKPNPPALDGIECHEKVAHLRWHPMGDNRAPILRFSIQFNTSFTPDSWDVASDTVPAIDTSWAADLSPWANYTFRYLVLPYSIYWILDTGRLTGAARQVRVCHVKYVLDRVNRRDGYSM
jgi:hypothetical protein